MSNFKNVAPQGQLVQARPQDGIQALLRNNWDRIAAVMPKHMTSERLFQLSVSAINQTPKLAACTPASLLSCILKCSALGLEPSAVDGLGRAYILPYGNQATFILGYRGMIELARRSAKLESIHAQAVYEGDEFDMWEDENGQHFTFRPAKNVPHDPNHLTDVYMAAHLLDGGRVIERMTKAEVEAIRNRSRSKNNGPWKTDYEAMALKTVIRRAAKYLPMSTQAQEAVAADEQTPDYSGVLDPVIDITADAHVESQQPEQATKTASPERQSTFNEIVANLASLRDKDVAEVVTAVLESKAVASTGYVMGNDMTPEQLEAAIAQAQAWLDKATPSVDYETGELFTEDVEF